MSGGLVQTYSDSPLRPPSAQGTVQAPPVPTSQEQQNLPPAKTQTSAATPYAPPPSIHEQQARQSSDVYRPQYNPQTASTIATPSRQSVDNYGYGQQHNYDQRQSNLTSPAGYRQNPMATSSYNTPPTTGSGGAIDRFNNVLSGDKSAKEYATEVYGSATKTATKLYGSASDVAAGAYSSTTDKVGEWSQGVSRWWRGS